MDQSQEEALALFQDGEYEKALEVMACSTTISPEEFKRFVEQCNHILAEQYKYLINDAISSGEYVKAISLREEFREKHGKNEEIEALTIPIDLQPEDSVYSTPPYGDADNHRKRWLRLVLVPIGVIGFFLLLWLWGNRAPSENQSDEIAAEECVEVAVLNAEDGVNNRQSDYNSISRVTTESIRRRMSTHENAEMLVPSFLTQVRTLGNGGYSYEASNGAYLMTMIGKNDLSAKQFVDDSCKTFNSTYRTAKDNWAVNSGTRDNMYYYAKAVKRGDLIYYAFFAVPKSEKENAKVYQELTTQIFKNSNFPIFESTNLPNSEFESFASNANKDNPEYQKFVAECKAKGMVGYATNYKGLIEKEFYKDGRYKTYDEEGRYVRIPGGIVYWGDNWDGTAMIYNREIFIFGTEGDQVDTDALVVKTYVYENYEFKFNKSYSIEEYCKKHEGNDVDLTFYWF